MAEKFERHILIVDDSATVRQLTRMLLEKPFGCTVTEAADGLEALEKVRGGESFDLIITDINMPRIDGLALIQTLRRTLGLTLPILIITTRGREKDRDKGMALGADAYLTKPFDAHSLGRCLTDLLGKTRAGHEAGEVS
jgi:CheY-like chemotaxis protein